MSSEQTTCGRLGIRKLRPLQDCLKSGLLNLVDWTRLSAPIPTLALTTITSLNTSAVSQPHGTWEYRLSLGQLQSTPGVTEQKSLHPNFLKTMPQRLDVASSVGTKS